jgi:hypothetical protein
MIVNAGVSTASESTLESPLEMQAFPPGAISTSRTSETHFDANRRKSPVSPPSKQDASRTNGTTESGVGPDHSIA